MSDRVSDPEWADIVRRFHETPMVLEPAPRSLRRPAPFPRPRGLLKHLHRLRVWWRDFRAELSDIEGEA